MKNGFSVLLALLMVFAVTAPASFAVGAKEATASMLLPTTGQAMNDQLGTTKAKVMAGIEVASVATIAILGTAVGGGVVWAGLGPLIANHLWSSFDAYNSAEKKQQMFYEQQLQMAAAQKNLEFSRQRRFEREQVGQANLHQRVAAAGEAVHYA